MTAFDDIVLRDAAGQPQDAPPLSRAMLDEAKARIRGWTSPARQQFVADETYGRDRLEADGLHGWNDWLHETAARVWTDFDRQVTDYLRDAPPGARVCVHGIEMLRIDDNPLADDHTIRWRQTVHQLADGEPCPRGTGSRTEYRVPAREGDAP